MEPEYGNEAKRGDRECHWGHRFAIEKCWPSVGGDDVASPVLLDSIIWEFLRSSFSFHRTVVFIVLEPSLILCDYKLIVFHHNLKTCPVPPLVFIITLCSSSYQFSPGEYKLCKDKSLTVLTNSTSHCIGIGDILLKLIEKSSQWIHVMLWDN